MGFPLRKVQLFFDGRKETWDRDHLSLQKTVPWTDCALEGRDSGLADLKPLTVQVDKTVDAQGPTQAHCLGAWKGQVAGMKLSQATGQHNGSLRPLQLIGNPAKNQKGSSIRKPAALCLYMCGHWQSRDPGLLLGLWFQRNIRYAWGLLLARC